MKTFKYITEVLDKPFSLTSKSNKFGGIEYDFNVTYSGDIEATFRVEMIPTEDEVTRTGGEFDVSFGPVDSKYDKIDSFKATGENDQQFRIMATVIKAMEKFVKTKKPSALVFEADKDKGNQSRSKLYSALVKRFAKKMGYDFAIDNNQWRASYLLTRKK